MTTSIGLIVMTTILAACGWFFLRAPKRKSPASWQRLVAFLLAGLVILFLLWMVIMVLLVGPAMRAM